MVIGFWQIFIIVLTLAFLLVILWFVVSIIKQTMKNFRP